MDPLLEEATEECLDPRREEAREATREWTRECTLTKKEIQVGIFFIHCEAKNVNIFQGRN